MIEFMRAVRRDTRPFRGGSTGLLRCRIRMPEEPASLPYRLQRATSRVPSRVDVGRRETQIAVRDIGTLAILIVVAAATILGPAHAQVEPPVAQRPDAAAGPDFALRACNSTPREVWISIAARDDGAGRWYVAGWWQLQPYRCRQLGRFPRPTIYLHAENAEGRQWNGVDAKLCVERNNFRYAYGSTGRCEGAMVGFYRKSIDGAWSSFEWRVGQ